MRLSYISTEFQTKHHRKDYLYNFSALECGLKREEILSSIGFFSSRLSFFGTSCVSNILLLYFQEKKFPPTLLFQTQFIFETLEIRQSKINSSWSLGRLDKRIVDQASDVPSIIFLFAKIVSIYFLISL